MIDTKEIQRFKSYLPQYLMAYHNVENLKNRFHCLNPNHTDNNPSMSYYPKLNKCHCFSCGINYDIYDLIELDYGLKNFREKHNKLAEIFNELDKVVVINDIKEDEYIEKNFSKYFNYCFRKISHTNYLLTRGIKEELLLKYRIGYDDKRKLIIFPLNDNSYFGRSTVSNDKYKSRGISYLFNENLLKYSDKNTIIYVTESIIDSLSLESIIPEIQTVSLNGITNINRLLFLCNEYDYKGCFVLALDNDFRGKSSQEILRKELEKINITAFSNSLISSIDDGEYKDINEALINNREKLTSNLNFFYEQYQTILYKLNVERGVDCEM